MKLLKNFIATTMLCAITLTVGAVETADSLDFTGTAVTVSGLPDILYERGYTFSPNGEYVYAGTNLGRPMYGRLVGDVTLELKWVAYDQGIKGESSSGWIFTVKDAIAGYAVNPEITDSVPMNGWVSGQDLVNIDITLTGCVENNIIIDPYLGKVIQVTGTGAYDKGYTYYGMQKNGYPAFRDIVGADTIVITYDFGWKLTFNDSVLYTNSFFDKDIILVPEINWVDANAAEGTRGNIMYIAHEDDVTINIYTEMEVDVSGTSFDGNYSFDEMVNDYPAYSLQGKFGIKYTIVRNDTAWFVKKGITGDDFSTEGEVLCSSTFLDNAKVPQNGWSMHNGSIPVVSGAATKFIFEGETITVTQSQNSDVDGVYTFVEIDDNSEKAVFSKIATSGTFDDSVLTIVYEKYPIKRWLIKAGDSILYFNSEPMLDEVLAFVPQNNWESITDGHSIPHVSGAATADAYFVNTILLAGDAALAGTYDYAAMVGGHPSFTYDVYTLFLFNNVWTISNSGTAPINDNEILATNANLSGNLVPQNRWMVSGIIDENIVLSGDSTFLVTDPSGLTDKMINVLTVYPNPTFSTINVDATATGLLEVYSLTGVCVMTKMLTQGKNNISISTLNNGVYLFVTNVNGKKSVAHVIKS